MSAGINEIENRGEERDGLATSIERMGGAHVALVCRVCVRRPVVAARTHRKKRDVCATQWSRPVAGVHRRDWVAHRWRCLPCVRSEAGRRGSHTSQKTRCMRHPVGASAEGMGGAHVVVFAMLCVRRPVAAARTHRKKRDVCATQWGHPQKGWVTHTWWCLPCCAFGGRSSRLAHIAKKRDVCATQWIGWAEKGLPPLTCHIPGLAGVFN